MPLKGLTSLIFILMISFTAFAQTEPEKTTLEELKESKPLTAAEIMRNRISKAKGYIAIKNYGAATYELENIRRETSDKTVHRVLDVLLMHAYLEQGDYKKAQGFLKQLHTAKDDTAAIDYLAVAGQVISGARTQYERYKTLGLSLNDRNLPLEAANDIEGMRNTLELIADQAKVLGKEKRYAANAVALLEESSNARGRLGRDVYDTKRWQDQVADAREMIVNPDARIINAVGNPPIESPNPDIVAANSVTLIEQPVMPATEEKQATNTAISTNSETENKQTAQTENETTPQLKPVPTNASKIVPKEAEKNNTANNKNDADKSIMPTDRKVIVVGSKDKNNAAEKKEAKDQPKETKKESVPEKNVADNADESEESVDNSPLPVGSLIGYATRRVNPVYPRQARSMRMSGTVKVEILVDEEGNVTEVENTEGPSLLKRAASDAIMKWQFKPFVRNGQPVKATGYVNFNFNM